MSFRVCVVMQLNYIIAKIVVAPVYIKLDQMFYTCSKLFRFQCGSNTDEQMNQIKSPYCKAE